VVNGILREIELREALIGGREVETVYFGGGTPSLLDEADLKKLLGSLRKHFNVNSNAEITLEANPDDINHDKLQAWKDQGINRLSIGVQSFVDEELTWMNRAHHSKHARNCIEQSLAAGITNISIDLIYGSPLLDDEQWKENVAIATGYNIPHLSCYALTVEEKTPLHKQINQLKGKPVDEDKQARQFIMLMQWLREAGYLHYEISNFAKPGFESRHNSAYWQGKHYLGLGPSAHSFDGKQRSWNPANNQVYTRNILSGLSPAETELLSDDQLINENIMISLRTIQGLDLDVVEAKWGKAEQARVLKSIQKFLNSNLVTFQNSRICLTDQGMLMADGIASELFR
jgi:oxygen-independent coproporphyrinogen III oxidase